MNILEGLKEPATTKTLNFSELQINQIFRVLYDGKNLEFIKISCTHAEFLQYVSWQYPLQMLQGQQVRFIGMPFAAHVEPTRFLEYA